MNNRHKTSLHSVLASICKSALKFILLLIIGSTVVWIAVFVFGDLNALSVWVKESQYLLQLWRLLLYSLVTLLWFSRVRQYYLSRLGKKSVYLLEAMMAALFLLIEIANYYRFTL